TAHGSSLDPAIHSLVAARLGAADLAERYFEQTVAIDSQDSTGSEALGLHIATLGGLWQATVFGFGGVTVSEAGIGVNPHLPVVWRSLTIPLRWHGSRMVLTITREPRTITVEVQDGAANLLLGEHTFPLAPATTTHFRWDAAFSDWQQFTP
ncbi:MAG: hypothetical protein H0X24_22060, partial [Ktedonobacterales bacterium]|nr:hypothetical protein [Ktedonobacterales bacterium]